MTEKGKLIRDLEVLYNQFEEVNKVDNGVELARKAISDAIDMISELSTIKKYDWIPCNDRLPEDRSTVLVTVYWHETYQVMIGSYFGDGLWWCVPFNNCGEHMQKLNPKAWKPLPKPFQCNK